MAAIVPNIIFDKMTNRYLVTWIVLVTLTIGSYLMSAQPSQQLFVAMLSITAVVKVFLVAMIFMDMRKANPAWLWILGAIMLTFVILTVSLSS